MSKAKRIAELEVEVRHLKDSLLRATKHAAAGWELAQEQMGEAVAAQDRLAAIRHGLGVDTPPPGP